MRRPASLLLLFWCFSAASAEISLRPERAVSPIDSGPAPLAQESPSIASNGRDFVAVWMDPRASRIGSQLQYKLYSSRLNQYAQPLARFGHVVADSAFQPPSIASNGRGYVAAYGTRDGVAVVALDDGGVPVSSPVALGPEWYDVEIASNGSTYAVAHGRELTLVSSSADVVWTVALPIPESFASKAVTAIGGTYFVVASFTECSHGCAGETDLFTATESGTLTKQVIASNLSYGGHVAAAAGAGRIAIAYDAQTQAGRTLDVWIVTPNTSVTRAHRVLTDHVDCCGGWTPSVGWDGTDFLVAWQAGSEIAGNGIDALRVSIDGLFRDIEPIHVTTAAASHLTFASNGSAQALVWRDSARGAPDIVARSVPRFADLASSVMQSVLISAAPSLQTQLQLAPMGNGTIAVWREGDVHAAIEAETDTCKIAVGPSTPFELIAPSVAAGNGIALVAWREELNERSSRIVARRMTSDCRILDFSPIELARESRAYPASPLETTAVAFDGTSFFVAWAVANGAGIHGMRVDTTGKPLDAQPIDMSVHKGYRRGATQSPRVVWTGSRYIVAWSEAPGCGPIPCKHPPPLYGYGTMILAAHVSAEGKVIVPANDPVVNDGGLSGLRIGFALGAGRPTLTWVARDDHAPDNVCLYVAQIGTEDNLPRRAVRIRCSASTLDETDVDLVWSNDEFLILWTDPASVSSSIQLLALNSIGHPFGRMLTVWPAGLPAFGISAVATASGVEIGYSRVAPEAANVSRVFLRSIDGLQLTRGRTAPH